MSFVIPAQHARDGGVSPRVVAVVLAGGQGLRMGGGDKALRLLGGRTLLDHVLARVGPQVDGVVLSANGDPARFAAWGVPVVGDTVAGFAGPLAGVAAGLRWAAGLGAKKALVVPCDTPFLPGDLVERLRAGRGEAVLACAVSAGRLHPVVGLWPVGLAGALAAAVAAGERRVAGWMRGQGLAEVVFSDVGGDPFANLNTPEELAVAQGRLAEG